MAYLRLFLRGALLVSLVAANTRQIATGRVLGAAIGGFLISAVWWANAHSAAHETVPAGWFCYACGAACGTVVGMWIVG